MPAKSKTQQHFMGMVYARKKGARVGSDKVKKAAASMTKEEAKKFASTSHSGLPARASASRVRTRKVRSA